MPTKKTKEKPAVNPDADEDVSTDELVETGEDAIAKYADGLETTDEAVAALDAVDHELEDRQKARKVNHARSADRKPD